MSRKIFSAIWLVAVAVFLASLAFLMGITYDYFTHVQLGQLKAETQLAAQGVMLSGEAYFDDLPENSCRMTWIAADGTVLYDRRWSRATARAAAIPIRWRTSSFTPPSGCRTIPCCDCRLSRCRCGRCC